VRSETGIVATSPKISLVHICTGDKRLPIDPMLAASVLCCATLLVAAVGESRRVALLRRYKGEAVMRYQYNLW
jgi:hypothetical protein